MNCKRNAPFSSTRNGLRGISLLFNLKKSPIVRDFLKTAQKKDAANGAYAYLKAY